jgi:hypothetical protein
MTPYTFELFAPYNKLAGLRLKNANARMFVCIYHFSLFFRVNALFHFQGLDIPMELNEEDGHWHVTIDLADGKIHFILLFLC